MAGLGVLALWARARGRLYEWKFLHRFALAMGPSGLIAVLAGWVTTEVGRQPWTIYGVMRTAESASPLAAPAVAASLLAFVLVYFAVFGAGVTYILKLMAKPPLAQEPPAPNIPVLAAGTTPVVALRPDALAN
jgi:cytochrome d ubiquinol oxidase subunit I